MAFDTTPTSLANLSHLTPRPVKGLFGDNYLSIADMTFAQQFLPEVYEKEVERYGKRTVGGFLRMVGAEMPMASDRVVWSEQGRLHIAYDSLNSNNADGSTPSQITSLPTGHLLGAGMTIVVSDGTNTAKARVTSVTANAATIAVYGETNAILPSGLDNTSDDSISIFVFGSEYKKGEGDVGNSFDASFTTFDNKPIILRDKYNVSGSDVAQIGWVEVTTEAGTGGYLWYLKSEHEARLRFEDYLEMSMVEAEKAGAAGSDMGAGIEGTEGMFEAIGTRGLVYSGAVFDGAGSGEGLEEFDTILKELDKQGAIEENMMFLNRTTALEIDNMLAAQNSYGAGGTSFGVFENSEEMALNLGFSGFRRGSYDFYKTDWKYLNDSATRGGLQADIEGVIVPAGTSTVYDEQLGQNISRPFLHVRYRANEAEDRRMKSWVTGSVGGNYTSAIDEMNVHFLSERALCVQAANNFVLLKK
jgi:hypothetical protein|tara:strand:- start:2123 stop:3541 length:1419 start_codon:yes stop_codon:yes gene_type:complete